MWLMIVGDCDQRYVGKMVADLKGRWKIPENHGGKLQAVIRVNELDDFQSSSLKTARYQPPNALMGPCNAVGKSFRGLSCLHLYTAGTDPSTPKRDVEIKEKNQKKKQLREIGNFFWWSFTNKTNMTEVRPGTYLHWKAQYPLNVSQVEAGSTCKTQTTGELCQWSDLLLTVSLHQRTVYQNIQEIIPQVNNPQKRTQANGNRQEVGKDQSMSSLQAQED